MAVTQTGVVKIARFFCFIYAPSFKKFMEYTLLENKKNVLETIFK
jgi:hypothetical protein